MFVPIVVLPAPLAKGLEFDGVIVVEPAEIAAMIATGAEGLVAVRGRHANPDGDVAQRELADAVHAESACGTEALDGLGEDAPLGDGDDDRTSHE